MGLIYHAALENSLIICFMDSRLWNAPLLVFFRLVDASKIFKIFKNRLVTTNRDSPTLLYYNSGFLMQLVSEKLK